MEMWGTVRSVFSYCRPTPYHADVFVCKGCWVRKELRTEQLLTEYVWQWASAFLMLILYTIMFVVMRGWLIEDVSGGWYWYTHNKTRNGAGQRETQEEKESKAIAKLLLL
jgi:hypothetical protein